MIWNSNLKYYGRYKYRIRTTRFNYVFVLLSRLDNRFGKIERELNEIKKRMDDYLKVQQRGVTEKVKLEGEALKKENEDISASPQIIEKTSTLETKQQKETVPKNRSRLLKQLSVRHWKEHVKRRLKQNWKMFVLRLFRNKRNK